MGIKIFIPTVNDRAKKLKSFENILYKVTERLLDLITQNWDKGKGANDKKMPKLTATYMKTKEKSGRRGIRDLNWKGHMVGSLTPVFRNKDRYVLTFRGVDQLNKARGNVRWADNMMSPISDRINRKLQKLAFALFTR